MNSATPLLVDAILVSHNQAGTLPAVLAAPALRRLRSIVVVDNGSTDHTAAVATDAGAVVLRESRGGYGAACLRAIAHLEALPRPPDVAVFLAPDGTTEPDDIPTLLDPIRNDNAELVVGVRTGRRRQPAQNRLMLGLIGAIYRHRFDDLGMSCAIRFPALVALALSDRGDALHVEMMVKAIKLGLHIVEVPVHAKYADRRPPTKGRSLGATGRGLFHILRHSTAR